MVNEGVKDENLTIPRDKFDSENTTIQNLLEATVLRGYSYPHGPFSANKKNLKQPNLPLKRTGKRINKT